MSRRVDLTKRAQAIRTRVVKFRDSLLQLPELPLLGQPPLGPPGPHQLREFTDLLRDVEEFCSSIESTTGTKGTTSLRAFGKERDYNSEEFTVTIPKRMNNGTPIATDKIEYYKREIVDFANGLSEIDIRGIWKNNLRQYDREENLKIEFTVPKSFATNTMQFMTLLCRQMGAEFGQESVRLTNHGITANYIEGRRIDGVTGPFPEAETILKNWKSLPEPTYGGIGLIVLPRDNPLDEIADICSAVKDILTYVFEVNNVMISPADEVPQIIIKLQQTSTLDPESLKIIQTFWDMSAASYARPETYGLSERTILMKMAREVIMILHQPKLYPKIIDKYLEGKIKELDATASPPGKHVVLSEIRNLIANRHAGVSSVFHEFVKRLPTESNREIRLAISEIIFGTLIFESHNGHDPESVKALADATHDTLTNTLQEENDSEVAGYIGRSIGFMSNDKRIIDALINMMTLDSRTAERALGAIHFHLYTIAKGPNRQYFINRLKELAKSADEAVGHRAVQLLDFIQTEHRNWFGNIYRPEPRDNVKNDERYDKS